MDSTGAPTPGEVTVKSTSKARTYQLYAVGGGDTAEAPSRPTRLCGVPTDRITYGPRAERAQPAGHLAPKCLGVAKA